MADNVTITSGAGATPPDGTVVATDDVSGVQYQRVKLDVGGDGASTPVTSTGLPVNDAGGSLTVDGTVAVSGTVTVNGSGVTQPISAAALPLPTGAATDTLQNAEAVLIGPVAETAPGTDTASSGLNGRLQRIAQRLTSLIALLPASLGQKASAASLAVTIASDQSAVPASQSGTWTVQPGNTVNTTAWKVDGSAVTQPISAATLPLPTNAATATKQPAFGTTAAPSADVLSTQTVDYSTGSVALAVASATAVLGPMTGVSMVLLRIDAISGCTVNVQGSLDNVTWSALAVANIGQAPSVSPVTSVGTYGIPGGSGFPYLRVIQNGAGAATVILRASGGDSGVKFAWSVLADSFLTKSYGAATASAPTYVDGTTNPLSLTTAGALRVDGSAVTQPVSGTVAATQSGSWTVTDSSNAADGATSEPTTDLMSGWDGLNVRAAFVQAIDGHNTLFVHDQIARRLLEEVLIELRINNVQMAKLLGPQALTQREMQPDQRLVN